LFPFTEFGAVARTYPVACSGVRQRNFDFQMGVGIMETIYDILSKEHDQVLDLFEEAISDGSKETFLKIKAELDPHLQGEEKLFYPVLKEKEEARESVLEGYEEHRIAEVLLSELESMDEKEERWHAKIKLRVATPP
jgi:hypothetical protein